jgi:DNA-binding NarL/FixJ family response regulator
MSEHEKQIRVFVADDHHLTRTALKNIFSVPAYLEVVGEAANSEELFSKLSNSQADVLVLDISMPGIDGLEILKQLRSEGNAIPVIVLTLHSTEKLKDTAMKSGATNFLSKNADPEQLIEAVQKAVRT